VVHVLGGRRTHAVESVENVAISVGVLLTNSVQTLLHVAFQLREDLLDAFDALEHKMRSVFAPRVLK
jgi:hypothetical protein